MYQEQVQAEREQHFYFVLNDFRNLVSEYGAEKIMMALDEETFWAIDTCLNNMANDNQG